MSTAQIIYHIFNIATILISIRFLFMSIALRKKNKVVIDGLHKISENRDKLYDESIQGMKDRYDNFVKECNERIRITNERTDLISRENIKLREENEVMKDRLRNLGIKYFD